MVSCAVYPGIFLWFQIGTQRRRLNKRKFKFSDLLRRIEGLFDPEGGGAVFYKYLPVNRRKCLNRPEPSLPPIRKSEMPKLCQTLCKRILQDGVNVVFVFSTIHD
jgi:hypothetical protein